MNQLKVSNCLLEKLSVSPDTREHHQEFKLFFNFTIIQACLWAWGLGQAHQRLRADLQKHNPIPGVYPIPFV